MLFGTVSGSALFLLICHPTGREPKATPLPPACSLGWIYLQAILLIRSREGRQGSEEQTCTFMHAQGRERTGVHESTFTPFAEPCSISSPVSAAGPGDPLPFSVTQQAVRLGLMVTGWPCTTCINKGSKKTSNAPSLLHTCCDTKKEPFEAIKM